MAQKVEQTHDIQTIAHLEERAERVTTAESQEFRKACLSESRSLPLSYLEAIELPSLARHSLGALLYATRDIWEKSTLALSLRVNLRSIIDVTPVNLDGAALAVVFICLELPRERGYIVEHMLTSVEDLRGFDIDTLSPLLRETTSPSRKLIYKALAARRESGQEVFWVEALGNSLQGVRTVALGALADDCLERDRIRPLLLEKLGSGDKRLRQSWVAALASIGVDASCVEALTTALAEEKHPDIQAALEALLAAAGGEVPEPTGDGPSGGELAAHERGAEILSGMRKAKLPTFLKASSLELAPVWRDGTPLSEEELGKLIARFRKEGPNDPINDLTRDVCQGITAESLLELGQNIEAAWLASGAKASHKWALYQLALTVHDEDIDRIGPTLLDLVSSNNWRRAQWYLDVFERIGSRRAKDWIYDTHAYASSGSALQTYATEQLERLIEESGLSHRAYYDQVDMYVRERAREERMSSPELIPGESRFELGGRELVLSMDAEFNLSLKDSTSHEVTRAWPEREPTDDPERYDEARKRFEELELDVRDFVARWREHLEVAMISGRPFSMGYIRQCFLRHPVLARLLETLVFVLEDGRSVRVTQGQVLDHDYDELELPEDVIMRLAHPLEVPEEVRTQWGVHLAECELIQIFPQFTRDIYMRSHESLKDFLSLGKHAVSGMLVAQRLREFGWHNGPVGSGGYYNRSEHLLPGRGIRLFLFHSSLHIQSDEWSDPCLALRLEFGDLRGRRIREEDVSEVVYSEACLLLKRLRDALLGQVD